MMHQKLASQHSQLCAVIVLCSLLSVVEEAAQDAAPHAHLKKKKARMARARA
jgi:hypothetical protein